jgi:hypothetical protein
MGKIEHTTGKRFFTTIEVYNKILGHIKAQKRNDWQIQHYYYLYVVHKIIKNNVRHNADTSGCSIHIGYLSKLIGKPMEQASVILDDLIEWEIIHVSGRTTEQKQSTKFQLSSVYNNNDIISIFVLIDDVIFVERIDNDEEQELLSDKNLSKSYEYIRNLVRSRAICENSENFLVLNH